MKSRTLKIISLCLVCCCIHTTPLLAATTKGEKLTSVDEISVLLPVEQRTSSSKLLPSTRGEALASSILSISNAGKGAIGVVAHTLLNRSIDWGSIVIYLDRWDPENEKWVYLEMYEYDFPNGNGNSTALDIEFEIINKPVDYYYRLRGLHEIEFKDEKNEIVWESHTTRTDGVFITDTP